MSEDAFALPSVLRYFPVITLSALPHNVNFKEATTYYDLFAWLDYTLNDLLLDTGGQKKKKKKRSDDVNATQDDTIIVLLTE